MLSVAKFLSFILSLCMLTVLPHAPARSSQVLDVSQLEVAEINGVRSYCVVSSDQQLLCNGYLFSGSQTDLSAIPYIGKVRSVSLDSWWGCAVEVNGNLRCWGKMQRQGSVGLQEHLIPVSVPSKHRFISVEVKEHFAYLISDQKRVFSLDMRTMIFKEIPVTRNYVEISARDSSVICGLDDSASLWCWGANNRGQLGSGDTSDRESTNPAMVLTNVKQVESYKFMTCASTFLNEIYCWERGKPSLSIRTQSEIKDFEQYWTSDAQQGRLYLVTEDEIQGDKEIAGGYGSLCRLHIDESGLTMSLKCGITKSVLSGTNLVTKQISAEPRLIVNALPQQVKVGTRLELSAARYPLASEFKWLINGVLTEASSRNFAERSYVIKANDVGKIISLVFLDGDAATNSKISWTGEALVTQLSSSTPKKYSTCVAMNREYPGGIAKSSSTKNRGSSTKNAPVVNAKIYDLNKSLDTDKDGLVCER